MKKIFHLPFNIFQNGFTLIELLVGITLFTVLAAVTIGLQSLIFRGSDFGITTALTIDNANEVLNGIVNELRKAKESDNGAFPLETAHIPPMMPTNASSDQRSSHARSRRFAAKDNFFAIGVLRHDRASDASPASRYCSSVGHWSMDGRLSSVNRPAVRAHRSKGESRDV